MTGMLHMLSRNERGTAVIELGVALPILMVLALATVDFVGAFSQKMQLTQYAQAGANFVVANGNTTPTISAVKSEVVATSGLTQDKVTVTRFTECNAIKVAVLNVCPNPLADVKVNYMKIEVANTYSPMLDIQGIADFVGTQNLKASVIVRLP